MKKWIFFLPIVVVLLIGCFSLPAFAATYCARPTASGLGNGSNWSNAVALSTVAGSSAYRGHTIYISGESGYGSEIFDAGTSGSSYITIKKATAGDHVTSTGWNSSWGTTSAGFTRMQFKTDRWVIDGQVGGGYGSWDSGHGIYINNSSGRGIFINSSSYISAYHIEIAGGGDDGDPAGQSNDNIYIYTGATDINLSHLYLHDAGRTSMLLSNVNNVILEQSYLRRHESVPEEHAEHIAIQKGDNYIIRNNIFEDGEGTGIIVLKKNSTSWTNNNFEIYGNVLWATAGHTKGTGNGAICDTSGGVAGSNNIKVFNNAFINISGHNAGIVWVKGTGNTAYNNIWYNNGATAIGFRNVGTHDYNWFYDNNASDQTLANAENNGTVGESNPFKNITNSDFSLVYEITGIDLTSVWDSIDTKDPAGTIRNLDGVWDRGVYAYTVLSPSLSPPNNFRFISP